MKIAVVAGASGLVGSALVRLLLELPHYTKVHLLVSKEIGLAHPKLIQHVVDFNKMESLELGFQAEDAFCTLGTTIAKAGSKEAFKLVDHDYVCSFAGKAFSMGVTGFYVVSSMGANPTSAVFYNKVKGEMEEDLKKCNFPRLGI